MEDSWSKASEWTSRNRLLCNGILGLCGETSCDEVISVDLCSHGYVNVVLNLDRCLVHPDVVLRFLRPLLANRETADYRSSSAR